MSQLLNKLRYCNTVLSADIPQEAWGLQNGIEGEKMTIKPWPSPADTHRAFPSGL